MADPIDEIERFLKRKGWTRRHLMPAFGDRGRVSEIMNRKRPLSIGMIRVLVFNYGLDAEKMIQWYPTEMKPEKPVNTLAKAFKDVSEAA
jgi:HTH-type transcriptional regulator/antitoxin HigA